MSFPSYAEAAGATSVSYRSVMRLRRLTSVSYAMWRPDAENSFKQYGLKESDYKKEIKNYREMKRYADLVDEKLQEAAIDYALAQLSVSVSATTSAVKAPNSYASRSLTSDDEREKSHQKMIRGVIDRSERAYALLYESLPDDIRELVNNNSTIVDGYGYSLWKWLELKFQSTEGDSVGKLWSDFTTAMQHNDEDWEKHKAKVDAIVRLLTAAKQVVPPALYATILLDRLVPKYNGIKMAIDSTKELGKDRENVDWSVVSKFVQAQERTIERQNNPELGYASEREAQAMSVRGRRAPNQSSRIPSNARFAEQNPELPFKGKDCCWFCGINNHSFRNCYQWLATFKSDDDSDSGTRNDLKNNHDSSNSMPSSKRESSPSKQIAQAAAHSTMATTRNKYAALSTRWYSEEEESSDPVPKVPVSAVGKKLSCMAVVNTAAEKKPKKRAARVLPRCVSPRQRQPPGLPLNSGSGGGAEETYKVEQILAHRIRCGREEYAVKWVGYSMEQTTWLSKEQLVQEGERYAIDSFVGRQKFIPSADADRLPNRESKKARKTKLTKFRSMTSRIRYRSEQMNCEMQQ